MPFWNRILPLLLAGLMGFVLTLVFPSLWGSAYALGTAMGERAWAGADYFLPVAAFVLLVVHIVLLAVFMVFGLREILMEPDPEDFRFPDQYALARATWPTTRWVIAAALLVWLCGIGMILRSELGAEVRMMPDFPTSGWRNVGILVVLVWLPCMGLSHARSLLLGREVKRIVEKQSRMFAE